MRLVASDLDGTLVRADGTMSERTLAALAACEADGVHVVFATGRPVRWMTPIAEATGHRGEAVCGNGAVVYDLGTERIVRTRTLTREAVLEVVHVLRGLFADAAFAIETLEGFRREDDYRPRYEPPDGRQAGRIDDLLDDDPAVLKVLCKLAGWDAAPTRGSVVGDPVDPTGVVDADAMLALARPALEGIAEPVHSGAGSAMLEISALGVSKASTLAALAADRGVDPADVVAFGDMPNDVPMLRWAGRGYAMADGHPEAIAAADHLAPPCDQDGVAQVLEGLLAQRPRQS